MDLNIYLKLLAHSLELNRSDITQIIGLGGMQVSRNRVDGWLRSQNSTKNLTGNSDQAGMRISRSKPINADEFQAFCVGLKPWLETLEKKV